LNLKEAKIKKRNTKFFFIILIFIITLYSTSHAKNQDPAESQPPAKNKMAPDFQLATSGGKTIRLSDCQGKVVVLVFWAFWCETWKDVTKGFEYLQKDIDGLPFLYLVVAIDSTMPEVVRMEKKDGRLPFPILIDKNGSVSERYRIKAVPTIFVIDVTGRIRYKREGYPGNLVLKKLIWKLGRKDKK